MVRRLTLARTRGPPPLLPSYASSDYRQRRRGAWCRTTGVGLMRPKPHPPPRQRHSSQPGCPSATSTGFEPGTGSSTVTIPPQNGHHVAVAVSRTSMTCPHSSFVLRNMVDLLSSVCASVDSDTRCVQPSCTPGRTRTFTAWFLRPGPLPIGLRGPVWLEIRTPDFLVPGSP